MVTNNFDTWGKQDINVYWNWLEGKTLLDENYKYVLTATINPFESYDLVQFKYSVDGDVDWSYIELKGRNVSITDYEDCIIEKYKIDTLIRISESTGKAVFVVALYYPSEKLAIWKLDASNQYETDVINCQWHTADVTGEMKNKLMVKLPLSEAKIYRF